MAVISKNGGVLVKLQKPQSGLMASMVFCANGKVLFKIAGGYKVRFDLRRDVDALGNVVEYHKTFGWVEVN